MEGRVVMRTALHSGGQILTEPEPPVTYSGVGDMVQRTKRDAFPRERVAP
jgi:hypothetical protein